MNKILYIKIIQNHRLIPKQIVEFNSSNTVHNWYLKPGDNILTITLASAPQDDTREATISYKILK